MGTFQHFQKKELFKTKRNWHQIKTIDMHTGGEPLRVIVEGFPELKGDSVLQYRKYCKDHFDHLRRSLILEPRGHADMYGCIITPPDDEGADFGVIFLHNEGYSTMCGHAIIALTKLTIEMKWIRVKEGENLVTIDAPCGRISSFATVKDEKVIRIRFHCVPSFVIQLDQSIDVPEIGNITYDLAYGGAFYAYVDMNKHNFDFDLSPESCQRLISVGRAIKNAVMKKNQNIKHPFEKELSFLYGTIFTGGPSDPSNDSRNVCIFADGELDRSPTGSGVSGRMAIHRMRDEIELNQAMRIESITDAVFRASVVKELEYGQLKAVIPEVEGTAYITGIHTFVIDPNDPLKDGFILR